MARASLPHVDAPHGELPMQLGPFELLGELGRGASGIVYLARQDWPERRIALKVLWNDLAAPVDRQRFDVETAALAKLAHPGIAHLYQAGTALLHGRLRAFLAMELVAGVPLRRWCTRGRPDLVTRMRCLIDVCHAIEAAHRQGVVHRDLKPENILVEVDGPAVRPRVLDFGVAKLLAPHALLPQEGGELVGTLDYMSPEQAMQSPQVDGRSDVYSLGAIAYELATGQLPLRVQGLPWGKARRRIAEAAPQPFAATAPHLAGDLERVLANALAKDPEDRYQTPREFADDLEAWLEHRPISVREPTPTYRLSCFARRQRLACASLVLAGFSLLAAAVSGWWAYADSRSDLDRLVQASHFTVDRVLGRLHSMAGTSGVRSEALRHLLPQIEECVRLRPHDVQALECKERILRYLGDIEVESGNWPAAAGLRRDAEAVSRELVAQRPADPLLHADWATAIVRVGDAAKGAGQSDAANEAYQRAHAIFETLAEAYPDAGRHVDDLAWSCDRFACQAIDRGDFLAAESLLQRRRDLLTRLDGLRPGSCTNLAGERELHSLWAHLEGTRGNHGARQDHLRAAIPLAREWLRRAPGDGQPIVAFASSVLSYVDYPHEDVPRDEAMPLLADAREGIDRLLVQEPRHALGQQLRQMIADVEERWSR